MPKITYVEFSGESRIVEGKIGQSLMQAATAAGVPGIVGECGGSCACGTCQIYVDDAWRERTGGRTSMEQAMLAFLEDVQENSRLSCQIPVTEALDGLIVRMPATQKP